MKEKVIIYGAGNTGKSAYYGLRNRYDVLFFIDSDKNIWGGAIDGKKICPPEVLRDYPDTKLVIASIYHAEILKQVSKYRKSNILIYGVQCDAVLDDGIAEQLDVRTIDLGEFLGRDRKIKLKELTFIIGGSGVLDYAFLHAVAEKYCCKKYMEIGTYIGESINIMTDCCDELYSITASEDSPYGARAWCKDIGIPYFANRLVYSNKIKQYLVENSKSFDFSVLPDDIDLFFIDGDHRYEGVYNDTKNVFSIKKKNAIVVWHDFRIGNAYRTEVVHAVRDAVGDDFKNVYVTNNNICGIYIPEDLQEGILCKKTDYEENIPLYTYDTELKVSVRMKES